jgi:hypothetical protein
LITYAVADQAFMIVILGNSLWIRFVVAYIMLLAVIGMLSPWSPSKNNLRKNAALLRPDQVLVTPLLQSPPPPATCIADKQRDATTPSIV